MADAKQEMNNGTSQSRSVLAKPRLGSFGSSGFGTSTFGSILRPSQLKPSSNPFLKVTETDKPDQNEKPDKDAEKAAEERLTETKEDAPKFVPLGTASSAPRSSTQVPIPAQPATGASGFVFGQNLSERVVIQDSINNGDAEPSEHSMKNGTSELLFTSAVASVKENNQEDSNSSSSGTAMGGSGAGAGAGLAAAAAEYLRAQARPPPALAAAITTGEEDELNVMQISCRLFAWESGSWRERGRGVLRLNDAARGGDASRLVARVAGSLRVVLNTNVWPEMVAERAGAKSLRITACDAHQQVKLFLVMGNPSDIVQLHRAVAARIAISRRAAGGAAARLRDVGAREPRPEHHKHNSTDEHHEHHEHQATDDRLDAPASDTSDAAAERDAPEPASPSKATKRKDPADDATSPKRPCPDIVVE